jgi:hypothetical protein
VDEYSIFSNTNYQQETFGDKNTYLASLSHLTTYPAVVSQETRDYLNPGGA